jgi:hypothetical protein
MSRSTRQSSQEYYTQGVAEWTFLTNHAHVLLCVVRESDTRLRRIADCVGITERATHRIVCDLVDAGYLTKHRIGRQSYYEVHPEQPLRHPLEADSKVGDLLRPLLRRDKMLPDSAEVASSTTLGAIPSKPSHAPESQETALSAVAAAPTQRAGADVRV